MQLFAKFFQLNVFLHTSFLTLQPISWNIQYNRWEKYKDYKSSYAGYKNVIVSNKT